jgi:cysteine protease ATG4
MAAVDFDRFKRNVIQYFWDPQPTNNLEGSDLPIWCLGQQYALPTTAVNGTAPNSHGSKAPASTASDLRDDSYTKISGQTIAAANSLDSSFDSGLAYDDKSNDAEDGGWPAPFLDDFESRLWFSYRSSFPPITKSQDPQALSSMTFAVRLRSQLGDQSGFTSDTGWGCMIRSGQSLLANAILALRLGRGMVEPSIQ